MLKKNNIDINICSSCDKKAKYELSTICNGSISVIYFCEEHLYSIDKKDLREISNTEEVASKT